MTNNRFYENRKEIQKIGQTRGVSVDVATRMLIHEKGWTNCTAELNAWDALVTQYQRAKDKTLADLFK